MQRVALLSKLEKRKQGKALREKCPRASHGDWNPRPRSQDPIKLLEESDADRIPGLIPLKYERMAESPFKFFRGAAIIQARDLTNSPASGIIVQACGDCHLMNFGGFATPGTRPRLRHQRLRRDISLSLGVGRQAAGCESGASGKGSKFFEAGRKGCRSRHAH
jgi:hypothetical protein